MNEGSKFESSHIHFSASQPALGYVLCGGCWTVMLSTSAELGNLLVEVEEAELISGSQLDLERWE